MLYKYKLITFLLLTFVFKSTYSLSYPVQPIIFDNTNKTLSIGNNLTILEDKSNALTIYEVYKSTLFKQSNQIVPNLGVTKSCFWVKFSILNKSKLQDLVLDVAQPTLDNITLFSILKDGKYKVLNEGTSLPFYKREFFNQNFLFFITIPSNTVCTYFIRIRSNDQVMLPITLGVTKTIFESIILQDLIFGVFIGTLLVMLLYNLFIYFTVRDKIYLYYVVYIFFIILVQSSLKGYSFRFVWPNNVYLTKLSIFIFPSIANISAILFTRFFLKTNSIFPNLNKILNLIVVILLFDIAIAFIGWYTTSFIILQLTTIIGSLFLFLTAYLTSKKGYRPAKFFLISWSFLLIGAIIFVLKDFAILPYNAFTSNSLQIGSALEVVLLSFALADKINTYKKETEELQAQALVTAQQKAEETENQNIILEHKVEERTFELVETNNNLNKTLTDLKEAQTQLVEAEKMASLGQLTAGIAHEINNPINFVSANIGPLKRDVDLLVDAIQTMENVGLSEIPVRQKQQQIDDYKEEIDFDYLKLEIGQLLNGIHEGASRTAEIVKGLKIFARLDEDDLKKADINEGLASTLLVANNIIGKNIRVIRNLGQIPVIECFPGKLNQVFLNIISNAIYAIDEKFGKEPGGVLEITTACDEKYLLITIADNGTGMSEATKNKIFEPFFTTKNVGVGTGLGMSIVYNTIKKHHGEIYIKSAEGEGTTFILKLHLIFDEYLLEDYQSEQHG